MFVAPGAASYGSAARFLGMLATTCGRWDDAEAHFQHAIAQNTRLASPPLVAHTTCDLARMLTLRRAPGDLEHARALLTTVGKDADALGLVALSRKAEAISLD